MVYTGEFQVFDGSENRDEIIAAEQQKALLNELRFATAKGREDRVADIRSEFERQFNMSPEEATRGQAPRVERAVAPPAETATPAPTDSPRAAAKKSTAKAIRESRA